MIWGQSQHYKIAIDRKWTLTYAAYGLTLLVAQTVVQFGRTNFWRLITWQSPQLHRNHLSLLK